jgi:Tfp pilus assembly protein PilO
MALIFQVPHDGVATEVTSLKDIFDLCQVLLLKGQLEQIISVVDLLLDQLPLTVEGKNLVLHEEGHVLGLIYGLERP